MLHALVLAALAALTPAAAPSASPSPTPEPLQVIATVHSSAGCSAIIAHANGAISSALANNTSLASSIRTLQTGDFQDNIIKKRHNLDALGAYASLINKQALAGDEEVKRLRKLANETADAEQKKELLAFADALGGAMWRQRQISHDLNGLLSTMDYYDMSSLDEDQRNINQSTLGGNDAQDAFTKSLIQSLGRTGNQVVHQGMDMAGEGPVPSFDELAAAAARDFTLRLPDIGRDEATAANHIGGATVNC